MVCAAAAVQRFKRPPKEKGKIWPTCAHGHTCPTTKTTPHGVLPSGIPTEHMYPRPTPEEYDKLRSKLGAGRVGDFNTRSMAYRAKISDPEKTGHAFPSDLLTESFAKRTRPVFSHIDTSIEAVLPNVLYRANGSLKEQHARTAEDNHSLLQNAWDVRRCSPVCYCASIQNLEYSIQTFP